MTSVILYGTYQAEIARHLFCGVQTFSWGLNSESLALYMIMYRALVSEAIQLLALSDAAEGLHKIYENGMNHSFREIWPVVANVPENILQNVAV